MSDLWHTDDEAATEEVGRILAARLAPDGVLLLDGPLGAGKTVLVRGLAAGLGLPRAAVQSPTYTLVHEHAAPGGGRLAHVDLYRLEAEDLPSVGLEEILAGPGVVAVEWAERLPWPVPGALRARLRTLDDGRREIRVGPA